MTMDFLPNVIIGYDNGKKDVSHIGSLGFSYLSEVGPRDLLNLGKKSINLDHLNWTSILNGLKTI